MSPMKELFLNPRLFVYMLVVLALSGYDAVATMHHIGRGVAAEGNPLMESLIEQSAVLFFFVKMAMTTFCMVICYKYSNRRMGRVGIHLAVGVYTLLTAYHTVIAFIPN
jgi:hypothetical protein